MVVLSEKLGLRLRRTATGCALLVLVLLAAPSARAWVDVAAIEGPRYDAPDGIAIVDGSYVMNVGELHINITNFGLIGSTVPAVCSWCDAPSAQWPAGTGIEYLYSAGLWVGGDLLGEKLVSTGMGPRFERELWPLDELEDTIYEAVSGRVVRPLGVDAAGGQREPAPGSDDDNDGMVDEETLNGYDDDGDHLVDEDFGQVGNQMMVCTLYDNTRIASEINTDHTPLQLQIVQSSFAWENDDADDFVAFEFEITNIGVAPVDDVYIGFFADADVGPRLRPGRANDDMAGSFDGLVQSKDGTYVPVSVGYMYDDDGDDGLAPGYFGIAFLGHDIDPTGRRAPKRVKLRSYQSFAGNRSFDQGGDPTNDAERYELLSLEARDANVREGKQNDFRFLVSAGPFATLDPNGTLEFQAALVVGPGRGGLLRNCAEAALTWYGNYFNDDSELSTGVNGRETKICLGDYDGDPNPIFTFAADYMDTSCLSQEFVRGLPLIKQSDLFMDAEANDFCIWVNLDNCLECARQNGELCTADNQLMENSWNCNDETLPDGAKTGCTGIAGNEYQIHWLVGMAPPPPGIRLWPRDNSVHVFWDNSSETTLDVRLNLIDFESYRIWRADNWTRPYGSSLENGPESGLWQLIGEYDIVNEFDQRRTLADGTVVRDTLPLGANTGLEDIRYVPVLLDDPTYDGLGEIMQAIVAVDSMGSFSRRPALVDRNGLPVPEMVPVLDWFSARGMDWRDHTAELDTFFAVSSRPQYGPPTVAKEAVRYYELVDRSVHNGFLYFYSVTATDHQIELRDGEEQVVGAGLIGDPGSSFLDISPGSRAQSSAERDRDGADIFVYPNPATRDALEEFQELSPNGDDPTGVRVCFANLPQAQNTIKIFSLNGDLVQTIFHDGTAGFGEASWNLVSRNGQEVVSGIYLYAVESDDDAFDDFIGKFVVIR